MKPARLAWWIFALFLFGVFLVGLAHADSLTARAANGDYVTISTDPCELAGWFKDWKKAVFRYQGATYSACWRMQGDMVMVLDSAGDVSNVPAVAFRKDAVI